MKRSIRSTAAGLIAFAFLGCHQQTPDPTAHGSAALRLRPVTTAPSEPSIRRTVYVAVYSGVQLGDPRLQTISLSSTVSVRNVSPRHPIVLEFVRFYDSAGRHVRDYIESASELPALATVEFVVQRADTTGGPGANFLIRWAGPAEVDEPLIEAVMVGQIGNAGISFTSAGRAVKNEPRQER